MELSALNGVHTLKGALWWANYEKSSVKSSQWRYLWKEHCERCTLKRRAILPCEASIPCWVRWVWRLSLFLQRKECRRCNGKSSSTSVASGCEASGRIPVKVVEIVENVHIYKILDFSNIILNNKGVDYLLFKLFCVMPSLIHSFDSQAVYIIFFFIVNLSLHFIEF